MLLRLALTLTLTLTLAAALAMQGCFFFEKVRPYEAPSGATGNSGPTGDTGGTGGPTGMSGTPLPASCTNGALDGAETAVDCGGGTCSGCALGSACKLGSDCLTTHCSAALVCAEPPAPTCASASATAKGPVLFFVDIVSGPNSGGENGRGAYVSLYGERFGASGSVLLAGTPLPTIVDWRQDAGPARGLDRIIVQLDASAKSGNFLVVSGGQASNPLAFAVRPGRIFLLDPATGSDTGDGTFAHPFASFDKLKTNLAPGDVAYVKGSHGFTTQGTEQVSFYLSVSGTAPVQSGQMNAPIAVVGYPLAPPTLGGASLPSSCHSEGILIDDSVALLGDWTFANLVIKNAATSIAGDGNGLRFVAIDASNNLCDMFALDGHLTRSAVLGSHLVMNPGAGSANVFSAGDYGDALDDLEIAWNEVPQGGACFYTLRVGVWNSGSTSNLRVHDNFFADAFYFANLANDTATAASFSGAHLYNNVFYSAAFGVILHTPLSGADFSHNTFVDVGGALFTIDAGLPAGSVQLTNNVFHYTGGVFGGSGAQSTLQGHNDYWALGVPSIDASGFPTPTGPGAGFSSLASLDFRLTANSVNVDAGAAGPNLPCADYLGVPRPQGAAPDAGAFEYVP